MLDLVIGYLLKLSSKRSRDTGLCNKSEKAGYGNKKSEKSIIYSLEWVYSCNTI